MKNKIKLVLLSFVCIVIPYSAKGFTTHTILFGGVHGNTYFPSSMNVLVGDTVKWVGDFSTLSLHSTSVPSGAALIGPVTSGNSYMYVVKVSGTYEFQNDLYAVIGMKGSFIASDPLYGITNEGREFYLGMLYPSYNTIATAISGANFEIYALVESHYENDVFVSFFDQSGTENPPQKYHIAAGNTQKVPLDIASMQMDTASDGQAYKSCHITSKYPVTIYYMSVGTNSGGSYLALPVLGLGKKYVAACYDDNPCGGAAIGLGQFLPTQCEAAGGTFLVIGSEDQTTVKITPTTTTVTGHPGSNTGTPHPYSIQLGKGQCYLVRSNGRNSDNDLSGSLIEASKPVAVISGQEDEVIGGVDGLTNDSRDFMIEQMVPVEYWDSAGYLSIPIAAGSPVGTDGVGDNYRIYTFDSTTVISHLDVQGIAGGFDLPTQRLAPPPEKLDINTPVEAYANKGKKISLMVYDERSVPGNPPWPSPSMMTIVPFSRWKTSYLIAVPENNNAQVSNYVCMNVLAANFGNISLSINGGTPTTLSSLSRLGGFNSISGHFPTLKGNQYRFSSGKSTNTYFLSSSDPFMVYYCGMRDFQGAGGSALGTVDNTNFFHEYAAPSGMQLNTGVSPSFIIDTQITCFGWHVCVRDAGKNDPGVKAMILIDDPDGVYWNTATKFSNVTFNATVPDYSNGELHPKFHSAEKYCFDVNFINPLLAASAPLAIVDNLGNAIVLRLDRGAPAVQLTTNPLRSSKPDSIVFPVEKIGQAICTTFVLKNTAVSGSASLKLNTALFIRKDTSYKITSLSSSLPISIRPQDSATIQVCYTPRDSARHQDSLILVTDCYNITISLDAHGSTGLISAGDLDFKTIFVGDTLCKSLQVKNVGSASFVLLPSYILSDTVNFSIDPKTALPAALNPGNVFVINICFHPKKEGSITANVDWNSDLADAFKHSLKDHSSLTGLSIPKAAVRSLGSDIPFTVHPNPVGGNSVIASFAPGNDFSTISIFDVLGREIRKIDISPDLKQSIVSIRDLTAGTYYLRHSSKGKVESRTFTKVK